MPGSPQHSTKLAIEIAITAVAAAFVYLLVFKFPATPILMEGDHLIFLYDAGRMIQGDVLYRDFFQFTFPGGQTLYYILFLAFGQKYWLLPAMICGIAALSAWLILRISGKTIDGYFYLVPAIVFIFFGFRFFGLDGSHRMLSPLAILAAVYFIARGTTTTNIIAAGLCCAAASFFTQQRGVIAVAGVGVYLLIEGLTTKEKAGSIVKREAILGGSFIVGLAILLSYFILSAGPETFYRSTIEYPSLYYRFHEQNSYGVFLTDLLKAFQTDGVGQTIAILPTLFYSFIIPIVPLAFLITYLRRRKLHDWQYWRLPMLLVVVSLILLLGTTAPSQFRIFQVSAPTIILLCWLISGQLKKHLFSDFWPTTAVAAVLIAFGAAQAIRMQTNREHVRIDLPAGQIAAMPGPVADRYAWLARNTKPGDHFYEVAEPFIYFPLQLRNPTAMNAIFMTELTRPEHIENVLNGLERDRPRFILWENQYNKPPEARTAGDITAPLSEYVQANYQPIGEPYTVDGRETQIWQRK